MRLLFVCLGNICRSPTAEGIMLQLVKERGLTQRFTIDSAGTGAYHVGESADPRSFATARKRGVHLPSVARQLVRDDFERFDYLLAMDSENVRALERLTRDETQLAKVHLLRSFDPARGADLAVPDPYYGEGDGFERVFDICEAACRGLLDELLRRAS